MTTSIRKLRREDLPDLLALYEHLHPADPPPTPREAAPTWEQLVEDPRQIYRGAFVGRRLVSACNASVIANLTRGARPYAVVENVVTHPEVRRRGIARATLTALVDDCWSRGCYKIMLMSAVERSAGHALYESLGFDGSAKQAFVLRPSG